MFRVPWTVHRTNLTIMKGRTLRYFGYKKEYDKSERMIVLDKVEGRSLETGLYDDEKIILKKLRYQTVIIDMTKVSI